MRLPTKASAYCSSEFANPVQVFPSTSSFPSTFVFSKMQVAWHRTAVHLSRLIGLCRKVVHPLVSIVRVHRGLTTDEQDGVKLGQIELADWFGIFQKRHEVGRVDKSQTDQVIDGVPALVTRITPRI